MEPNPFEITCGEDLIEATRIVEKVLHIPIRCAWFRGHFRASWQVRPKICREVQASTGKGAHFTHADEHNMLVEFRRRAPSRLSGLPNSDETAAWIGVAQHYGLPTRLVDWTESILVAAHFAVNDEREERGEPEDAAIFALDPYELNRRQLGKPEIPMLSNPRLWKQTSSTDKKAHEGTVVAVMSPEMDLRMLLQQAAFTLHRMENPLTALSEAEKFMCWFRIPAAEKARVSEDLQRMGVRRSALFPELEHLAAEIKRRHEKEAVLCQDAKAAKAARTRAIPAPNQRAPGAPAAPDGE